jgi:hypothetical protein
MFQIKLWQPVLETKSASNPEPFLTLSPLQLVQTGEFYKVPWIMGSTSEDGAFFGASESFVFLRTAHNHVMEADGTE